MVLTRVAASESSGSAIVPRRIAYDSVSVTCDMLEETKGERDGRLQRLCLTCKMSVAAWQIMIDWLFWSPIRYWPTPFSLSKVNFNKRLATLTLICVTVLKSAVVAPSAKASRLLAASALRTMIPWSI